VHKVGSDLSKPKSNNSVPVISVGFKINLQWQWFGENIG
jgi:hypothetical protein